MAAITALSLLGYDATISVKLDGEHRCRAIYVRSGSRLVRKALLHCLGCVLRVVVLLEGEPSPQSEVLSALEQVFINDLSDLSVT